MLNVRLSLDWAIPSQLAATAGLNIGPQKALPCQRKVHAAPPPLARSHRFWAMQRRTAPGASLGCTRAALQLCPDCTRPVLQRYPQHIRPALLLLPPVCPAPATPGSALAVEAVDL